MKQKSAVYGFMRNGSTILLIIFGFLFIECSCKHNRYNYSNYRKLKLSDKIIKLQSTVVNKFELFFPAAFSVINNYLVLVDSKADELVKIIDLRSNELLISFGSGGQGPDEFMGIRQIIPDPNDKTHFWVYDISASKLKYYDLNNILSENFYPEEILNIAHEDGYLDQLIILPDKSMLGLGIQWKGRISIYDMTGRFVKSIGRLPLILKDERFAVQHSHGFIGNLAYKDVTKQIYIATRYGGIVEKYNMDGKLISTFLGPDSFFPEYDIVPTGQGYAMTYNKNTRFGYLDICYIKRLDRLFLLYSGKYKYSKDEKIQSQFGNIVYVLNSKDTIVETIELDKEIFQMCISDDGSTIFGLSQTEVLKYDYINGKSIGVTSRR